VACLPDSARDLIGAKDCYAVGFTDPMNNLTESYVTVVTDDLCEKDETDYECDSCVYWGEDYFYYHPA